MVPIELKLAKTAKKYVSGFTELFGTRRFAQPTALTSSVRRKINST